MPHFFIDEGKYSNQEVLRKDKAEMKEGFDKREIDIVIFKGKLLEPIEKYAIELKYIMPSDPTSDKMHEMLEDVAFIQQLTNSGMFSKTLPSSGEKIEQQPFNECFAVTLCNMELFYQGNKKAEKKPLGSPTSPSRYEIFRGDNNIIELSNSKEPTKYIKSTGKEVKVKNFKSKWIDLNYKPINKQNYGNYKYYIVEFSQTKTATTNSEQQVEEKKE